MIDEKMVFAIMRLQQKIHPLMTERELWRV